MQDPICAKYFVVKGSSGLVGSGDPLKLALYHTCIVRDIYDA